MTLLEIADLSDVWIEAEVYEKDADFLRQGQTIRATVEALPHRIFSGKVALVYPQLDAATRTNRVRFTVSNSGGALRPGMYATAEVNIPLHEIEPFKTLAAKASPLRKTPAGDEVLAVPERAVIDTGAKQIVYVESAPGVFDGVAVQLGPRDGDYYAVVAGLRPGQRVAAAGAFLIDAETRLNPAAAAAYFGASGGPQRAAAVPSKPPAAAAQELTAEQLKNIDRLPAADRPLARAAVLPRDRAAAGVDGRAAETGPPRPDGLPLLPGLRRAGNQGRGQNAEETRRNEAEGGAPP